MSFKPRSSTPALSILMLSLLLAGCANEKALLTQTQPLQDRIERVEQSLANTTEAGLRAAKARAEALAKRQNDQEQKLTDTQAALARLGEQAHARETRMADVLAQHDAHVAALNSRLGDIEKQLNAALALAQSNTAQQADLQSLQDRDTAQAKALTTELASAQGRIEELNRLAQTASLETSELVQALRQRQDAAELAGKASEQRLRQAEAKLDTLSGLVQEALALAAKELFLANGREAFSVMLTDDKVLYPQNDPNLDLRDVAKLSDLAGKLAKLDQEYHLDIQGHTANTSTDDNNYSLGKARAEVVKRHLHEKQGISLSRMSTLSYGANKPLDNGSSNRRIFIRVLVLK